MKPINFLYFLLACIAISCNKKNKIDNEAVIYDLTLSRSEAPADGITIIDVTCRLHSKATSDRRDIRFALSAGQFVVSKDTVLIQKAQFDQETLMARAQFIVPSTEGVVRITAQPNVPDIAHHQYLLTDSVMLTKVLPASIGLSASAASVAANGGTTLQITGVLRSTDGGRASEGFPVLFEDIFESGVSDTGEFITASGSSDNVSEVKASYAVGAVPVGSRIQLICTLLDANRQKTTITDTINIYVNE